MEAELEASLQEDLLLEAESVELLMEPLELLPTELDLIADTDKDNQNDSEDHL